jgi:hypothetical protein
VKTGTVPFIRTPRFGGKKNVLRKPRLERCFLCDCRVICLPSENLLGVWRFRARNRTMAYERGKEVEQSFGVTKEGREL